MDRIAEEGIRLENMFVTTSLCGPSRASILTGKYANNHGIQRISMVLSKDERTFPELLKDIGYEIAFIGKWHNIDLGRNRGFDYYFGFKGQGRYFNPLIAENDGPDIEYKGHVTDILTDHAIKFLKKKHTKPFCLLLWFKAPHMNWEAAERFQSLFQDVTIPKPKNFNDTYEGKPDAVKNSNMRVGDFDEVLDYQSFIKNYYRCLAGVDESVGRVLDVLEMLGCSEDTVVVYSSDNGFFLGEHQFFDKRFMYEESIRVPLLMRYPRMVKPGTLNSEMILNLDIAPTILDLAGSFVPDTMDGRSFLPFMQGKQVHWREDFLYEYNEYPSAHTVRKHRGIRTIKWKYIHYYEELQEFELYDLENDPHEMKNLIHLPDYYPIVEKLRKRMRGLRMELKDPDL